MILLLRDDGDSMTEVCYVPFVHVIAVSLRLTQPHEFSRFSSGAIRLASGPAPSRLTLARATGAAGPRWSQQLGHPMTLTIQWGAAGESDEELPWAIHDVIVALDGVIGGWTRDEMARDALIQAVDGIVIAPAEASGVELTERHLRLAIGPHTPVWDAAGLRRAIERLL